MKLSTKFALAAILGGTVLAAAAQNAPFGGDSDQALGDALWDTLRDRNLVGDNAIMARPYMGTEPHGAILVTLEAEASVEGNQGPVIIKRNYGGDGASVESVSNQPGDYLMSTTVMFQREGFDPDHNDWFWAKYLPDGSYDSAPNGTALVGAAAGCIGCHMEAEGGDMVYLNDRY